MNPALYTRKSEMKRKILFAGIIFSLCTLGFGMYWYVAYGSKGNAQRESQKTVEVAGTIIQISIADTPELRERGLGGRANLVPNEGMLFIFPSEGKYSLWMKNMRFPIDILWISADKKVVDIWHHARPESYPLAFTPKAVAMYVLELPADFATHNNVRIGDMVS